MKPAYTQTPTVFQNWRHSQPLRPGADDHKKHGSRQPDGSVKPYARPVCAPCYRQPQARYSNN